MSVSLQSYNINIANRIVAMKKIVANSLPLAPSTLLLIHTHTYTPSHPLTHILPHTHPHIHTLALTGAHTHALTLTRAHTPLTHCLCISSSCYTRLLYYISIFKFCIYMYQSLSLPLSQSVNQPINHSLWTSVALMSQTVWSLNALLLLTNQSLRTSHCFVTLSPRDLWLHRVTRPITWPDHVIPICLTSQ